jgi:hypothetical protein
MRTSLYIINSTIFVGYTLSHATKTAISGYVQDSASDLLLLYAQGHTFTLPPVKGISPTSRQRLTFSHKHSSDRSLIKKNYHEQSPF